jgi:hypothetical protein
LLLIKSYKTFIKEYHDAYKQFCESILNAESNFLGEEGFESYVINTPFFQFGKEIKNILKVQREQFDSIVKNQVNTLEKKIADLYDDLKKLHKYEDTFTDFMNQMYESLNELERKYVDDYINGKYQKHIKYYSNKNKEDIFTAISYMNNSCLLTKQKYKETFLDFKYFNRFYKNNNENNDNKTKYKNPHLIYLEEDKKENENKIINDRNNSKDDIKSWNNLFLIGNEHYKLRKLPSSNSTFSLLKGYNKNRPLSGIYLGNSSTGNSTGTSLNFLNNKSYM